VGFSLSKAVRRREFDRVVVATIPILDLGHAGSRGRGGGRSSGPSRGFATTR